MNVIITATIKWLAGALVGSVFFDNVLKYVKQWAASSVTGEEKRQGVLDDLRNAGILFASSAANIAIELAVQYLKRVSK